MKKKLPQLSEMARSLVEGGHYRHYKNLDYQLLHIARHSETLEELVVYQALYGERGIWVRPLEMFCEEVEVGGERVPRFKRVDSLHMKNN